MRQPGAVVEVFRGIVVIEDVQVDRFLFRLGMRLAHRQGRWQGQSDEVRELMAVRPEMACSYILC